MVAKYTAKHMKGPQQSTRWDTKREWTIEDVRGQDCFGSGRGRKKEQQESKISELDGQEGFVTFAMMSVKHLVAQRPKLGESVKPNDERKEPIVLELPDSSVHIRTEGTTVQLY